MKIRRFLLPVIFSLCVPGLAFADSDGYYCVGRGYLAYQFGMAPMPIAPHRVYVMSLRGPSGIPESVAIELPQFQVHGIVCGEGWIDVASFTAVYRITLGDNDRPVRYEMRSSHEGQPIPQVFIQSQSQNLGPLAGGRAYLKPIRSSLAPKASGGEYVLEVVAKTIGPVNRCEISVTSRVVETDSERREVNARVVFEGRGHRACGGGGTGR